MAKQTTALDPLVGRVLGRKRYEVLGLVAAGGMATVYRGHDRQLDRTVAIKVPRPEYARDQLFAEQFRREARAAARLGHPNIVAVYDSGTDRGTPWIVMELVEGPTLRDLLDRHGRFDVATTAELLAGVADALDHAHRAGVAHLDVKPENILVSSEGAKVADFGLVRAARGRRDHAPAGSPHYLAPEVITGGVVDGRADIYALGVVTFECLTGAPPFGGDRQAVMAGHLRGRVPAPSSLAPGIGSWVDAAVLTATEPDPAWRFNLASDLTSALGAPRRRRVEPSWSPADDWPVARPTAPPRQARPPAPTHPPAAPPGPALDGPTTPLRHRGPGSWAPTVPAAQRTVGYGGGPGAGTRIARPTTGSVPRRPPRRGRRVLLALLLVLLVAAGVVVAADGTGGLDAIRPKVHVPDVVGLSPSTASRRLGRDGLAAVTGPTSYSEHVPLGRVESQSVQAGKSVRRGTTVELVVSAGRPFVTLPAVAGQSTAAAERLLGNAGVKVAGVTHATSATVGAGTALGTVPAAGRRVRQGSPVTLVVSSGPPLVTVPNLRGDSRGEARRVLAQLGLHAAFPLLAFGNVVNGQEPPAGTGVQPGSTIDLSVPFF